MRLELPYPPSVNNYWRTCVRGKRVITYTAEAGKRYRRNVEARLFGEHYDTVEGPLRVDATFRPPDRRQRDLDNCLKALLDALEHCRVFRDDAQIVELRVRWDMGETGEVVVQPGGMAIVTVERLHVTPMLFDEHGIGGTCT